MRRKEEGKEWLVVVEMMVVVGVVERSLCAVLGKGCVYLLGVCEMEADEDEWGWVGGFY